VTPANQHAFKAVPSVALMVAIVMSVWNGASATEPRPNILFILADDMGWQDTSVPFAKERTRWNDRCRTPAHERLAREGIKFTQAYACAVCSPTRVRFLTGQNQARYGVTQWTLLSGEWPTSDLPHPTLSFAHWNRNGSDKEERNTRQSPWAEFPRSMTVEE
jgi:hypothetical protein